MEVIGGHQESDVGELPAGWRIVPLGKLVASVEYGSSAKSRPSGEVPVLRMGNLQDGKVVWDDLVYTDSKAEIGKYFLTPGDVLFNRTNTIDLVGKTSLYLGERPAIFAGYLIRITVEESKLDARYLNYILNTRASKRYSAKVLSVAVGQANINGQKLKTYPILLPPTRAEQEAIAEALSDADALIEFLEGLLVKKRQIKQGAMQELLTGKKRLPGFGKPFGFKRSELGEIPADWESTQIGTVVDVLTGFPFPSKGYSQSGVRLLRGSNVKRGATDWYEEGTEYWPVVTNEIRQYLLKAGDVVVAMDGSLVGRSFARLSDGDVPALLLQRVARLRSEIVDQDFLGICVCSPRFTDHCDSVKTVTAIPHISPVDIRAFRIALPPTRDEQKAIAQVVADMDLELTSLESKLAKARQIKNGMMQELLTGRIRLI